MYNSTKKGKSLQKLFLNFFCRFDCLSEPSHHCCSPHPAIKRHTEEHNYNDDFIDEDIENIEDKNKLQYMNSRVTATITRVLKSISWL